MLESMRPFGTDADRLKALAAIGGLSQVALVSYALTTIMQSHGFAQLTNDQLIDLASVLARVKDDDGSVANPRIWFDTENEM